MKQIIVSLFIVLQSLSVTAQEHEATMYFLDGTDVTGYATLKFVKESFYGMPKDKVSFKVSPDDVADLWDDETISKVVFHDFGEPKTFEYINVTYVDGTQASLFQVIAPGEVTIYAEAVGVWDTEKDNLMPPQPRNLKAKRSNEKDFANLTSKKKIAAYFNQCPGIVEKLDNGDFNSRTIEEMVTYYNETCATSNVAESKEKTPQINTAPVGE